MDRHATLQTLESLAARYPWPTPQAAGSLEWLWHFDLAVTPEQLWPHLCDTSALNRHLGLPKIEYRHEQGELRGSCRYGPLYHAWVEPAWTWLDPHAIMAMRRYSHGMATEFQMLFYLEPREEGRATRLYIRSAWAPRGLVGRLLLGLFFPAWRSRYARAFQTLEGELRRAPRRRPLGQAPAPLSPEARSRLGDIRASLRDTPVEARLYDALLQHIQEADDFDVQRLRVKQLARDFDADPKELLVACLYATRRGLLELSWDVICPHCRGASQSLNSLGDIPSHGSCPFCVVEFENAREDSIEVTFRVHPSIRPSQGAMYCAAEPAHKAHIALQARIPPGHTRTYSCPLKPGRYRLRRIGRPEMAQLQVDAEPSSTAQSLPWRASQAGPTHAITGTPEFELENDGVEPCVFVVESMAQSPLPLRPKELFSLHQFRDLFTEEHIATGVQLAIGEQTLLFTDIVGSTELYETHGDGEAFALVKEHFVDLFAAIEEHQGVVVKTIGDAAMAAFAHPLDAFRAAHSIQLRFLDPERLIKLRISLNTGPCIAVNLNNGIDYFGCTVNRAAKLQECAGAGQIAFPQKLVRSTDIQEFLAPHQHQLEELTYRSSKLPEDLEITRWTLDPHLPKQLHTLDLSSQALE